MGCPGTNSVVGRMAPTVATIRMGRTFKPNGIDIRKLRCVGVEISMDPSELFDKKSIGLQRGNNRIFLQESFLKNFRLTFLND